jgi:polar amino acid transport system substrate-binding protein
MKRILCIVGILLAASGYCRAETVVLATGDWAPYVSEKLEEYGPIAEIVTKSFANVGIEVKFEFYPWKRCEFLAENGDVFATFPFIITPERQKFSVFSDSIAVTRDVLFYNKKHIKHYDFTGYEDLKQYAIGSPIGYNYTEILQKEGVLTDPVENEEQNFRKLEAGRIDFVPADERVGWQLIGKLFPDKIADFAATVTPFQLPALRLMVSRKFPGSADMLKKFNIGLSELNASGETARILKKHMISE